MMNSLRSNSIMTPSCPLILLIAILQHYCGSGSSHLCAHAYLGH